MLTRPPYPGRTRTGYSRASGGVGLDHVSEVRSALNNLFYRYLPATSTGTKVTKG